MQIHIFFTIMRRGRIFQKEEVEKSSWNML